MQMGDVPSTSSDCSELESWIGFRPKTSVSDGVGKFIGGIGNFIQFEKKKYNYPDIHNLTVAIIGLGYVGLPLAVELAKKQKSVLTGVPLSRNVIGFDIDEKRIQELKNGFDRTNEISDLADISFDLTSDFEKLVEADIFIITVPTPIDKNKKPDLNSLKNATSTVAKVQKLKRY